MPKPIDDTEMLAAMAEDIVAGRAETPTGAMRLHGVERGSGQERRLLKKWAVHGDVLLVAMRRAALAQNSSFAEGYNAGLRAGRAAERETRDAAMIAGTSALAQPAQVGGTMTPGTFYEAPPQPPSWWERITSRRAKVVE